MKSLFYRRSTDGWLAVIIMIPVLVLLFAELARPEYREAMSNAELRKQHNRLSQQPTLLDSSLPIFALVGMTGVGKSSFIGRQVGNTLLPVNHR